MLTHTTKVLGRKSLRKIKAHTVTLFNQGKWAELMNVFVYFLEKVELQVLHFSQTDVSKLTHLKLSFGVSYTDSWRQQRH